MARRQSCRFGMARNREATRGPSKVPSVVSGSPPWNVPGGPSPGHVPSVGVLAPPTADTGRQQSSLLADAARQPRTAHYPVRSTQHAPRHTQHDERTPVTRGCAESTSWFRLTATPSGPAWSACAGSGCRYSPGAAGHSDKWSRAEYSGGTCGWFGA